REGDRHRPHPPPLRRADGRPRPEGGRRDPEPAPGAQPRARQDHHHGHPRPSRVRPGDPHRVPEQGRAHPRAEGLSPRRLQEGRDPMRFIPLIWSNLRRKKTRTVLTLRSIIVAFILFGFLSAIRQALVGGVSLEGANRLIVRHKVSIIQLLPESYKRRMERIPGVAVATHQTWFGGIYQDPKNFFMQCPVIPDEFFAMHPEFLLPAEQMRAWQQTRTGAVVGRKTAERFKWKVGDKVPIQSTIWSQKSGSFIWEFDIVGIFNGRDKGTDTTPLFFRYDYFDEARSFWEGQVGWYTIRINDTARSAEVAKLVDAEFENSSAETKTEPEGAFIQGWAKQIGAIGLITASILGAVFFTILLVTGNTI